MLGQFASGDPYWVGLITTGTILYILAASLNLVFGYAGLFALGQQGLYAVGAYVSVIVGIHVTSLALDRRRAGAVCSVRAWSGFRARASDGPAPRRVPRAGDDRLRGRASKRC